jgi:hypothetical protein
MKNLSATAVKHIPNIGEHTPKPSYAEKDPDLLIPGSLDTSNMKKTLRTISDSVTKFPAINNTALKNQKTIEK